MDWVFLRAWPGSEIAGAILQPRLLRRIHKTHNLYMLTASRKPSESSLSSKRADYASWERKPTGSHAYSPFNPAQLFLLQQRQRTMLDLLDRHGFNPLAGKDILELGCGRGGVLHELLSYEASPKRLHGADLIIDRVREAHERLPHLPVICADGRQLPYEMDAFDLVLQYTVFSSVLDPGIRANIAQEMLRVLRPGGMIVWYDFWLNPTNPHTRGIRPTEIRKLFPWCNYDFRRVTLAPPITRQLAPRSWLACYLLESLRLFNTHYLVAIRPDSRGT
jgi:SAM-dependent methyltransferase